MNKPLTHRRHTDRLRLGDVVQLPGTPNTRGVVWNLTLDPARGRVAHVLDLSDWTAWTFGEGDRRPPVLEPQQFVMATLAIGLHIGKIYIHSCELGIDQASFQFSAAQFRRTSERLTRLAARRATSWRYVR